MIRASVFVIVLLVLCGAAYGGTSADRDILRSEVKDEWLSGDKLVHVLASAYLVGLSYRIYHTEFNNPQPNSRVFAFSFSAAAGIGKELYDMRKPDRTGSWKDMTANAAGITLGLLLFTYID